MKMPDQNFGRDVDFPRPSEKEIVARYEIYKKAEEDQRGGGQYLVKEIEAFLAGKGDLGLRERVYQGWTRPDFESLLQLIKDLSN